MLPKNGMREDWSIIKTIKNEVNSLVEEVLTWGEYNDIEGYILVLLGLLRLNNYIRQDDKGEEFMRIFKDTRKDIFDNLQGGSCLWC